MSAIGADTETTAGEIPPEDSKGGGTRSVDRALGLLAIVSDNPPISLTDASRRADLNISTAMRLLRTLQSWQFVDRDPDGLYVVGSRLIAIGAQVVSQDRLYELAGEVLLQLSNETKESSYLAVLAPGETAVYLRQVESSQSIRHSGWVGRSVPVSGTAIGQALTGRVPGSGYVTVPAQVEEDAVAFAASVEVNGVVVGGLSVVMPKYRLADDGGEAIGRAVRRHADRLAALLVGSPLG